MVSTSSGRCLGEISEKTPFFPEDVRKWVVLQAYRVGQHWISARCPNTPQKTLIRVPLFIGARLAHSAKKGGYDRGPVDGVLAASSSKAGESHLLSDSLL